MVKRPNDGDECFVSCAVTFNILHRQAPADKRGRRRSCWWNPVSRLPAVHADIFRGADDQDAPGCLTRRRSCRPGRQDRGRDRAHRGRGRERAWRARRDRRRPPPKRKGQYRQHAARQLGDTGFHTNTIDVEVHDLHHLTRLIAALRAADAVNMVGLLPDARPRRKGVIDDLSATVERLGPAIAAAIAEEAPEQRRARRWYGRQARVPRPAQRGTPLPLRHLRRWKTVSPTNILDGVAQGGFKSPGGLGHLVLFGQSLAITSFVLRPVKGPIRTIHQRVEVFMLAGDRDAEAGCRAGFRLTRYRMRSCLKADRTSSASRAAPTCLSRRKHDGEFLAAEAGHDCVTGRFFPRTPENLWMTLSPLLCPKRSLIDLK